MANKFYHISSVHKVHLFFSSLLATPLAQRLIYDILLCHSQFYIWHLASEVRNPWHLQRNRASHFSDHLDDLQSHEQNILGSYTAIPCVLLVMLSHFFRAQGICARARAASIAMNLCRKLYLFLMNNKINFSL